MSQKFLSNNKTQIYAELNLKCYFYQDEKYNLFLSNDTN